jgi:hypothetical protein
LAKIDEERIRWSLRYSGAFLAQNPNAAAPYEISAICASS